MSSFEHKGPYFFGQKFAFEKPVAIVASRFNQLVVQQLINGANAVFRRASLAAENIHLLEVPGAFETLYVSKKLLQKDSYAGLVILGAVIRGETPHFDMIAGNIAQGVAKLNLLGLAPVVMGVLTTDTIEQALNRAGLKSGNSGEYAASCLLEMIALSHALDKSK